MQENTTIDIKQTNPNQSSNQTVNPEKNSPNSPKIKIKPSKKPMSLWTKIKISFYSLVLLVFVLVGAVLYVMINPSSNFAQFAQKYLGFNYVISNKVENASTESDPNKNTLSTEQSSSSDNASTKDQNNKEQGKILNNLLGIGGTQNTETASKFADSKLAPSTTEQVVEQALPSVVSITVQTTQDAINKQVISGTGFFVSEEGLIMTNKHVVAQLCSLRADQVQILATDYKDQAWDVALASVDPVTDLAILKVKDPKNTKFSKVSFYPSQNLKLGMDVIAIGNALGQLKNTVTTGVVSGIGRSINSPESDECGGYSAFSDGLIQTDAAINGGNSGGPLFNKAGTLIGVNTSKFQNAELVGFAIPADDIVKTLNSYLKNGKISKPYLGVIGNNISNTFKKLNPWIPVDYGIMVDFKDGSIYADSGAAKAGLKAGDIILSINDEEIRATDTNDSPLRKIVSRYDVGAKVKLKVLKSKLSAIKNPDGTISQKVEYEPNPEIIEVTLGSLDSPV